MSSIALEIATHRQVALLKLFEVEKTDNAQITAHKQQCRYYLCGFLESFLWGMEERLVNVNKKKATDSKSQEAIKELQGSLETAIRDYKQFLNGIILKTNEYAAVVQKLKAPAAHLKIPLWQALSDDYGSSLSSFVASYFSPLKR